MLLSEYITDINENRIKTHQDALKYFPARYSSFNNPSFSSDYPIPACTLAQYGFYYDEANKLIRCFECCFEYADLRQGLLTTILHKHHKHRTDCTQILNSLENFLDNNVQLDRYSRKSPPKPIFNCYANLANRLASFDNVRLHLDKRELCENGLYRVLLKDTLSRKRPTELEQISRHVPSLIHIKCAFCPYECLVSKTGAFNTLYKSPVREHQEKYADICSVFASAKTEGKPVSGEALDWLREILRLDCKAADEQRSEVSKEQLSVSEEHVEKKLNELISLGFKDPDDVVVAKLPRSIDQMMLLETRRNKSLVYAPQLSSDVSRKDLDCVTNDFARLQSVLSSLSDNVISEKAYHPAFRMHYARLESFKDWPQSSQSPADLAKAGFYYFGVKDMVKCFFCNGGLKDWTAGDDPYQDHVRWFPKCQFIRQLMGPEYIEETRRKFKSSDSGFTSADEPLFKQTNITANKPTPRENNPPKSVSPVSHLSLLDKSLIRRVTEANLASKELIRQAIEKRDSTGEDQTSRTPSMRGIEVVKLALELGEAFERQTERLRSISDFMICNLMACVGVEDVKALVAFQFGVIPAKVRILREYGSFGTRCVALVCVNKRDEHVVERIVKELDQKYFLPNKANEKVQVYRTKWTEFEEKIKPFLKSSSSADVSKDTEMEDLTLKKSNIVLTTQEKVEDIGVTGALDIERSNLLREENERLKSERLCVVCLTKDKNVLLLPCAHLTTCLECSFSMQNCPLCRSKIQATVRTYC